MEFPGNILIPGKVGNKNELNAWLTGQIYEALKAYIVFLNKTSINSIDKQKYKNCQELIHHDYNKKRGNQMSPRNSSVATSIKWNNYFLTAISRFNEVISTTGKTGTFVNPYTFSRSISFGTAFSSASAIF